MTERKVLASWGLDLDDSDSDDSFSSFTSPRQTKSLADGLGSHLSQSTDQTKMKRTPPDPNDQRWSQPITGFTSRFDPKYIEQQRAQELLQAEQEAMSMSMQQRSSYATSVMSEMIPLPPCEKARPLLRSQVRPITLMDILKERKEEMNKPPQSKHHDGRRKMMQALGAKDLYAEEMERRLLEDQRIQALDEQKMLQIEQSSVGKLRKSRSRIQVSRQVIQERPPTPSIPDLSNGTESSDDWTVDIETRSSVREESKRTSISMTDEMPSSDATKAFNDALEITDSMHEVESKIFEDDCENGLRELERQQEEAMKQAFKLANQEYLRRARPPKALTPSTRAVSETTSFDHSDTNPVNPLSADMQAFANSLDEVLNRDPNHDQPSPRPRAEILPMKTVKAPPHRNGLPIEMPKEFQSRTKRIPMAIDEYPPILPQIGLIPKAPASNAAEARMSSLQSTAALSQVPLQPSIQAPAPYALQMQYLAMSNPILYYQMMSQGLHPPLPMMMTPPKIPSQYWSLPLRKSAPVVPQDSQYHSPLLRNARPQQTLIQQQQAFIGSRRPHRHRDMNSTLEVEPINVTPSINKLPAVEQWRQHVVPEQTRKTKKVFESDDDGDSY